MQSTGESIHVLHVDDEPDFAETAAAFLEREDDRFEVATATSASEGIDRLAGADFDCIVSDYDMPGEDGIEFLQTVREMDPDLPFLLFTGKGSEEIASEAISAGVTDYLQKASGTEQYALLANRIATAVEGCRARREVDWQRTVIQNMGEGVYVLDSAYTFQYVQFRLSDIDGLSGANWTGRPVTYLDEIGLLTPAETDRIEAGIDRILDGETDEVRLEVEPALPESTQVLSIRLTAIRSRGHEDLVLGTSRDVTERTERERLFRAVFNNTYTFTGLLEPDGTVLEVNEAVLSCAGLGRDDVVGTRLWETPLFRSNDEAATTIREAVERARNGDPFRDEIRIPGPDREVVLDCSVRPITDDRGNVTHLVPEGRDITERTVQERNRERIIDRVSDAVVEVDPDWQITLVNDRAADVFGRDGSRLLGRDFLDAFPEAAGTRLEEASRTVMETREPVSIAEHGTGLGDRFDIDVSPMVDGGVALFVREVTD